MSLLPSGPKTNHKKGIAAARKAEKRKEADERQVTYALLTREQKLQRLRDRGITSGKEFDRLNVKTEA